MIAQAALQHRPETLRDALARIARTVERLGPSHRDPERFHIDKAEVVQELRSLARRTDRDARPNVSKGETPSHLRVPPPVPGAGISRPDSLRNAEENQ
jgi:hypothetical protein